MKQLTKKGYTLVEMLFIMAVMVVISTVAITKIQDSARIATIASMKHDIKAANLLLLEKTYNEPTEIDSQCATYSPNPFSSENNTYKGKCLLNGVDFKLSENNLIYIQLLRKPAPKDGEFCSFAVIISKDLKVGGESRYKNNYKSFSINNCLSDSGSGSNGSGNLVEAALSSAYNHR